jgi:outer membrane receptor protein involved in Fe transport
VDLSGTQVQQQPRARISLGAAYDLGLGQRGTLTLQGRVYYSSEYNANDVVLGRDRTSVQKAYSRTDLRASWLPRNGHLRISAFVENLEDEAVLLRLVRGGDNILQGAYAAPRTWGVALTVSR